MNKIFASLLIFLVCTLAVSTDAKPGSQLSNKTVLVGVDTGNNVTFTGGDVSSCVSTGASDLKVDASSNLKVTSTTYSFQQSDVGHPLLIAPVSYGTTLAAGWTQGFYNIASVSNGAAILSISPAATSTTGGAFYYGIAADCTYFHQKNLNVMRFPFSWEQMQATLGGSLVPFYLGQLENNIRQAGLLGMTVIPDCHNFGAYNGIQIGAAGGPTYAQFANLWTQIATAVSSQAGFGGYELMNEPNNMPSANIVPQMYQAVVTALRAIDTISPIYLDGDAFASSFGWLGNCSLCGGAPQGGWNPGGNNDLLTIIDPNNNLIYVAHAYADYNNSGTYPTYPNSAAVGCTNGQTTYQCAQTMGDQLTSPTSVLDAGEFVKRYSPFVSWCVTGNRKCAITESGIPYDDANWLTTLDNGINYLQKNNILFTYWVGAPWGECDAAAQPTVSTNCSYILGVYPTNLSSAPIDTPQMAVLTKYSNAYSPSTYQLTGPARGTASVASTNFTVTYQGYVRKSFVITPNDNSAGGSFSPTSITCSAGFNCVGNFTYTAPGTDVYAISTTNNQGLSNPVSVGYATIADQFSTASVSSSQVSNALALRKIYAPYIGNALTLRKAVDNTQMTFGFTSVHLNAPLNTPAILAWNGTSEIDLLGGTIVIPQYAPQYSSDGGVVYVPSGTALTKVTSSPATGQYAVSSNGHYTFNAGDIGNKVKISYLFQTYVVNWYDQSPQGQNALPPYSDSTGTNADQPLLLLNCQNGQPCISFGGSNRMDIVSPLSGTQQTVLSVIAPNFHWGQGFALGWDWDNCGGGSPSCLYNFNDDFAGIGSQSNINDQWQSTGSAVNGGGVRMYSQDNAFHALGGTLTTNTTGGIRTFLNGSFTGQNNTGSLNLYLGNSRNNATLGYQRFSGGTWVGEISELVVLNTALSNANVAAFQADEDTYWGITNMASYSWPTPTLAQNSSSGNPPPWAGMNQSGAIGNFGIGTNFATSSAGQTYYASRGFNIVRLPVQWEQLQQNLCTGDTTINSTWLTQLDSDVSNITASKMDALIDLHNFGGYNYSAVNPCGSPPDNGKWTSTTTSTYFVNFWTQLAAHYASNPKVHFDLMNEPAGTTASASATIQQSAITAIRGQSFNNYIFTEFGNGFAACSDVSANSGPAFITLTDTQNKLILECHAYLQGCGNDTCGDYAVQTSALSNLSTATTYCAAHSCKLFWGEFNMGYTPSMYSEVKVALDLFAANPTVWAGWTEFGAGPAWGENYPGLIEPRQYPTPYADRGQMRFLATYATQHSWPSASGAWPYNIQFP